jgi:hypothetical protein
MCKRIGPMMMNFVIFDAVFQVLVLSNPNEIKGSESAFNIRCLFAQMSKYEYLQGLDTNLLSSP